INMNPADAKAVAAYVRSVLETIGRQGMPPGTGKAPPSILVGDAKAGQAFFDSKCAACHSATGDLAGIAAKVSDPKALQNLWVSGGGGRGGRGGGRGQADSARIVTAKVAMPSGEVVEGQLMRIDDFFVTLRLADESLRTIRRDGDAPK